MSSSFNLRLLRMDINGCIFVYCVSLSTIANRIIVTKIVNLGS